MIHPIRQTAHRVLCGLAAGASLLSAGLTRAAAPSPPADHPFPDVPRNHWAYDAVEDLRKRGILQGYPATPPPAPPKITTPKRAPARKPAPRRGSLRH